MLKCPFMGGQVQLPDHLEPVRPPGEVGQLPDSLSIFTCSVLVHERLKTEGRESGMSPCNVCQQILPL